MLHKIIVTVVVCVTFYCCTQKERKQIIITGAVENLPSKKIYLANAYYWDVLLDSTEIKNGNFQFTLDSSKFSEPFLATVSILDSVEALKPLFIVNYKRTNGKDTFANSGFMIQFGKNELTGHFDDSRRISVKPNRESDLAFDLKTENFGSSKNISFIQKTISENSSSNFLIQKLYQYKYLYTANELQDFLSLFNSEIRQSETGTRLAQYCTFLPVKGEPFTNETLININGAPEKLFNSPSKINMLIFWASWCGPCRLEIPQLKNIRNEFTADVLSMKSISIDEDAIKWRKAVEEELMPWPQLLVPGKDADRIKAQFGVYAVPVVVFTDENNKEIKRFTGYNENNLLKYKAFIDSCKKY